jgi:inorganic triphosphatase YgiF
MVIQAKYRVNSPETFLRLQIVDQLAGFSLSTTQIKQVHDTYMDTRGRRLITDGYSFRRREQSDGVMMTLSTLSRAVGAVHRWEKWEVLLASERQLAKWPDSLVRSKLLQLIGNERLLPLVDFQQTRILRSLFRGERRIAEVRLDSVSQKMDAAQKVHFEMEVDLSAPAGEETLTEFMDYLEDEWNLWPEKITKFELAYEPAIQLPAGWFKETEFKQASQLRRAA